MKNPERIKLFGSHLRRLREERDLSQQNLANIAGVAKITIQRIENSKYSPTLDMLITLAEALDITLKELVDF